MKQYLKIIEEENQHIKIKSPKPKHHFRSGKGNALNKDIFFNYQLTIINYQLSNLYL
jgi:hypothetical protein